METWKFLHMQEITEWHGECLGVLMPFRGGAATPRPWLAVRGPPFALRTTARDPHASAPAEPTAAMYRDLNCHNPPRTAHGPLCLIFYIFCPCKPVFQYSTLSDPALPSQQAMLARKAPPGVGWGVWVFFFLNLCQNWSFCESEC